MFNTLYVLYVCLVSLRCTCAVRLLSLFCDVNIVETFYGSFFIENKVLSLSSDCLGSSHRAIQWLTLGWCHWTVIFSWPWWPHFDHFDPTLLCAAHEQCEYRARFTSMKISCPIDSVNSTYWRISVRSECWMGFSEVLCTVNVFTPTPAAIADGNLLCSDAVVQIGG